MADQIQFTTITRPNSLNNRTLEYTVIKIFPTANTPILIFSIYAPTKNTSTFIEELENLYTEFKLERHAHNYVIAGDFNARNTVWGDSSTNHRGAQLENWELENTIQYGARRYSPISPTYPAANSYLDHCMIHSSLEITDLINDKLRTIPHDSDHNAIVFTIALKQRHQITPTINHQNFRYNYKKTNWKKFTAHLRNLHQEINSPPENRNLKIEEIDTYLAILESIINKAIIDKIPKFQPGPRDGALKYVNNRIKKLHNKKSRLITELHAAQNQPRRRDHHDNIIRIKRIIKLINMELDKEFKKAITSYYTALHQSINFRNSDTFFPKLNKIFHRKKGIKIDNITININEEDLNRPGAVNTTKATRIDDNLIIQDPTEKLNLIGLQFEKINSPRYTNQNTETKRTADVAANFLKETLADNRAQQSTITNFSDNNKASYPTHEEEQENFHLFTNHYSVENLIEKIGNKTSSGLDNIPPIVIKHLPIEIIKDYTILFNNSINNTYYPVRWKSAKVLPLHKSGKDPTDRASYRPISITCSISKIYQKIIKFSIDKFIYTNNIIPANQFGFRQRLSTSHAINKFLSDTNNYLLNGRMVGAILIDLEKAFDSVWHNGLMFKLIQLNFNEKLTLLILDMISNTDFKTWDGKSFSTIKFKVAEGLPQGTVTSPTLFNIYNSEILNLFGLNSGNNTHSIAFADDLIIYVADPSPSIINTKLKQLIDNINKHYQEWNLKMNPGKCEYITFRKTVNEISFKRVKELKNQTMSVRDPNTRIETPIPTKATVKYLGLHLDHLLRMNAHHNTQLIKARKAYRAHYNLFHSTGLDAKAKTICYQLLVRPILAYAAPVWWNMGPSVMEKFRKLERNCLRACTRLYKSEKTDFKHRINNKTLYNSAKITRFDCFTLKLTRNYYSKLYKIGNTLLDALRPPEGINLLRQAKSGYTQPEAFITLDKLGFMQDQFNVPHIYHMQRHQAKKKISLNLEDYVDQNRTYDWTIPEVDLIDNDRLNKKYGWLEEAKFIDELKVKLQRETV